MALETLVAGRYSGTYNTVDTGISEGGYELEVVSSAQQVTPTDLYGDSVIDIIYRGGNCFLNFTSIAFKAGSLTPFWPWEALGVMASVANPIARLGSDVAKAMVLSSTANTPAAASPASLTASKAILPPGTPAKLLYSSELRKVPVRLMLLPYVISTGVVGWHTMT